jgi:hypothetical protein
MSRMNANTPINFVVVGTGRRINVAHINIIKDLNRRKLIHIVGVYNRTIANADIFRDNFDIGVFSNIKDLIRVAGHGPKIALVGLKYDIRFEYLKILVEAGFDILLETPFATDSVEARKIKSLSLRHNKTILCLEHGAFIPEIMLQKAFISENYKDNLRIIINDEKFYAYHAVAVLNDILRCASIDLSKINKIINSHYGSTNECTFIYPKLNYHERFFGSNRSNTRLASNWKIVFENSVFDLHTLFKKGGEEYKKYTIRKEFKDGGLYWSVSTSDKDKLEFFLESSQDFKSEDAGLLYMYQSLINSIHKNGEICYSIDNACDDYCLWRIVFYKNKIKPIAFMVNDTTAMLLDYFKRGASALKATIKKC